MSEHFETGSKIPRGRGKAQKSIDLIEAMRTIALECGPITGRGVGYKLFSAGLISSMSRSEMQRVYRLLREAREQGIIDWDLIADETRKLEKRPSWDDPAQFAEAACEQYRRDFWQQQPARVEVWSEKGTIRGVLQPVLDKYAVGFRVLHGFSSATSIYSVAQDNDGRELYALYLGDHDPSGLYMSEHDLPDRLQEYGGEHVTLRRIALLSRDTHALPSFPASDKRKDPRYDWFVGRFGRRCWELDAMDPGDLRARVEQEIKRLIEPVAWRRCERVSAAEQKSLQEVLSAWGAPRKGGDA